VSRGATDQPGQCRSRAAFLAAAIPPLVNEATALIKHGPQYLQQLQDKHTFIGHLNNEFHLEDKLKTAASQKLSISSVGGLLTGEAIVSFTVETIIVLSVFVGILDLFHSWAPPSLAFWSPWSRSRPCP
jgi:hypothetical protein